MTQYRESNGNSTEARNGAAVEHSLIEVIVYIKGMRDIGARICAHNDLFKGKADVSGFAIATNHFGRPYNLGHSQILYLYVGVETCPLLKCLRLSSPRRVTSIDFESDWL